MAFHAFKQFTIAVTLYGPKTFANGINQITVRLQRYIVSLLQIEHRQKKAAMFPPRPVISINNTNPYWSRKLRIFRLRDGCFSFRSAFASIWRMRSRVTENCWPTSSSV